MVFIFRELVGALAPYILRSSPLLKSKVGPGGFLGWLMVFNSLWWVVSIFHELVGALAPYILRSSPLLKSKVGQGNFKGG